MRSIKISGPAFQLDQFSYSLLYLIIILSVLFSTLANAQAIKK